MEKLYKGIHKFQEHYKEEKDFFEKLGDGQAPPVLLITCSDSRIDPNLITNSKPGEIFIVRNVGNIVPPFSAVSDKNSIAAAIEFAIEGLNIRDIIICGHSDCGAMKAIYEEDKFFEKMPHLKNWLFFAQPVKEKIKQLEISHKNEIQQLTEKNNVLSQLENLISYPIIKELLEKAEIRLYGWYYEIKTGKIYELDRETKRFQPLA
ncbi:MAG: carbonic anhydrase [Proteobacteria bacterium]|nr:carbonic anhydrase [Pseudomonadota bacterium]